MVKNIDKVLEEFKSSTIKLNDFGKDQIDYFFAEILDMLRNAQNDTNNNMKNMKNRIVVKNKSHSIYQMIGAYLEDDRVTINAFGKLQAMNMTYNLLKDDAKLIMISILKREDYSNNYWPGGTIHYRRFESDDLAYICDGNNEFIQGLQIKKQYGFQGNSKSYELATKNCLFLLRTQIDVNKFLEYCHLFERQEKRRYYIMSSNIHHNNLGNLISYDDYFSLLVNCENSHLLETLVSELYDQDETICVNPLESEMSLTLKKKIEKSKKRVSFKL